MGPRCYPVFGRNLFTDCSLATAEDAARVQPAGRIACPVGAARGLAGEDAVRREVAAALRDTYGLRANDELILEDTEAGIPLRPAVSVPIGIYTEARLAGLARGEVAIGR